VFKIIQKTKFLSMNTARKFESKLFNFLVTQDILVDTWKFTSFGDAWNNLYTDFESRRWTHLVLKLNSRTSKGLTVWELVGSA
jgi:hypothetical protein